MHASEVSLAAGAPAIGPTQSSNDTVQRQPAIMIGLLIEATAYESHGAATISFWVDHWWRLRQCNLVGMFKTPYRSSIMRDLLCTYTC
jgi:hypothetical protein